MSNHKFFTLIHGDQIHLAPQNKIIPKEAFSQVMDAYEITEQVKKDAIQYRLEVTKECEKLKDEARKIGFEEGYKKWLEQLAHLETEIVQVRQELEKFLVPVALKAAKKIVGREIELADTTIVDIVSNSLKTVAQHKKITIYVNKKDLEILDRYRPQLKQIFEALEVLSLRERTDVTQGGCIIETELGIIDARLENQWRALEGALEQILKKKLATKPQDETVPKVS